jgi:hypothetical protein
LNYRFRSTGWLACSPLSPSAPASFFWRLFRSWVLSPTFTAGEGDVGRAFATVTHSTALADVSRDFKSAVASMRIIVKDFSVSPDNKLVVSFAQAHATALKALETLAASIDQSPPKTLRGFART